MSPVATRPQTEGRTRAASEEGGAAAQTGAGTVTFAELVHHHYRWRAGLDGDLLSGQTDARRRIEEAYRDALARFEHQHGPIINAYWCTDVESAVALTSKRQPKRGWRRLRALCPETMRFHRVSDWATKQDPQVARLLHECDELAIHAIEVLGAKTQRICMQLVMASAAHLLSLVDPPAAPENAARRREALDLEQRELAATQRYYREAANSEAQMTYFAGMGLGLLGLGAVVGVIVGILALAGVGGATEIWGALSAGALGGVVSVIARVNSGSFELDFDVDRRYTTFLGAMRPVIGAAFGLAMFFAVSSGLLSLFKIPDGHPEHLYFLYAVSFVAGFSERWAQDALTEKVETPVKPGKRARVGTPRPRPLPGGADGEQA